ncbi:hypothetical protein ACJJID_03970 [Microbulbifer sp. CnH-101-G]|uniref:hypothetical protein n=1 Tax=Microbulbifer sp. CnH-101-G TaxID=3243393 RepID=UPI004039956E
MRIHPGVGVGVVEYGITEKELISIIGDPDKIDEEEYVQGSGDWHRVLWYWSRNIHFTFDKDDDYRLGTITVVGSDYPLMEKELFNLPQETVRHFVAIVTGEIPKREDWMWSEEGTHTCLEHNGLGILFWFDNGNLSEMQCSYLFEPDNETVIWPQGHKKKAKWRMNTHLLLALYLRSANEIFDFFANYSCYCRLRNGGAQADSSSSSKNRSNRGF